MSVSQGSHLVRQIGLWSGVAVVVGSTIGSGIFKNPSGIASKVPDPWAMLMVWVLGGVLVMCGALVLAEVGSAYPFSGGIYVYVREAFGRRAAFLFTWAQLTLLRPSSAGALALVCGQYTLRLFGYDPQSESFAFASAVPAILAIAVVTWANVRGVKFGTGIQNVTTVAKAAGLLALVALAFFVALPSAGGHFRSVAGSAPIGASAIGLALVSVLWAYDGWADAAYISGEVRDPRRNVPRSIILGTALVIGVYLLANVGYLAVFSVGEIGGTKIIAAEAMQKLVGGWGVPFIVATVMLSTFGTLNGTLLTSPRIFFAAAEDRLFFPRLAGVHPRFNTPHVAVTLVGCLGATYVVVATLLAKSKAFEALTDAFVISMLPFYALAVGSVFVFRARAKAGLAAAPVEPDSLIDAAGGTESQPHAYRPSTKALLFPLTPLLFIASTVYLLVNSLVQESSRVPTMVTLAVLLVGLPVYAVTVGRRASGDPITP